MNHIFLAVIQDSIVQVNSCEELPPLIHAAFYDPANAMELYLDGEGQWTAEKEQLAKQIALSLLKAEEVLVP
ncbi:MAG: hypothetical protein HY862_10570 [Chloroflexi bacterium]|nr:hypothetical protein [Chloroflexota bacterium]